MAEITSSSEIPKQPSRIIQWLKAIALLRESWVGSLGGNYFSTFNALEFDPEGNLYLAGSSTLYRVNLDTGKATPIGGFGTTWSSETRL